MSVRLRKHRRFGHVRVGPVEVAWGRWMYDTGDGLRSPFLVSLYVGDRFAWHPVGAA